MRVTNKMLSNTFLSDMRTNLENMKKLQEQMTSGKEIRRPSDDPFKVARAMQLYTDINANKQYNSNITDTINWLNTTDTALGQVGDVFQRVRELLVSAGNAGYSSSERAAIKDEINEKIGEIAQILNTNFDGAYIFGGTRGTTKPVDVTGELIYKDDYKTVVNKIEDWKKKISFVDKDNKPLGTGDGSIDLSGIDMSKFTLSDLSNEINKQLKGAGIEDVKAMPVYAENSIRFINNTGDNIIIDGIPNEASNVTVKPTTIVESGNTKLVYYNKNGNELPTKTLIQYTNIDNWQGKKLVFQVNGGDTPLEVTIDTSTIEDPEPPAKPLTDQEKVVKSINKGINENENLKGKMQAELVKEGSKYYIKLTSLETNEINLVKPEDDSTLVADISDEVYDKPIGNIQYEMIASKLKVQISQGVTMDYSVSASDILEFTNSDGEVLDLRQILTDIVNHLGDENSVDKLTSEDLKNMDDVISNLLKIRSEVGAKQNRMDSAKEKNTDANFNMTEILSETEDIDITEKTMEYATMQTVYLASLQTSAKVLQPSLIDYL